MTTYVLSRFNHANNELEELVICSRHPLHESILRAIYAQGWSCLMER